MMNIFKNLFLALAFPLLFYLASYHFLPLIWILFVPAVLLVYRSNNYWGNVFYILITSALISFVMVDFVKDFNSLFYFYSFAYVWFVFFIVLIICFFAYKKIINPYSYFILPILWTIVVAASNFIRGGNFWFDFAHFQPMLFPVTKYLGSLGMNFLIMLFSSLLAFYILTKNKKLLFSAILLSFILFSSFLFSNFAHPADSRKIKVALVQGNISDEWMERISSSSAIFDIYERLSLQAAESKPDIIVWPEYAVTADIKTDEILRSRISELAKKTNSNLVFGSMEVTEATDPLYNNIKNVTNVFSRNGEFLGKYAAVLPFEFNGNIVAGNEFNVIDSDMGKFGINSCLEEVYFFINKYYVKQGANFLVNVSNDEGIKNLRVRKSKSMFSQFSASENGKYLLRASNSGNTAVFNPYGKIIGSLEPEKEGVLIAEIYLP